MTTADNALVAALRVREGAQQAQEALLRRAATFAALHMRTPILRRVMRNRPGTPVLVTFEWPGILRVFDPSTGEQLAESVAGNPRMATFTNAP